MITNPEPVPTFEYSSRPQWLRFVNWAGGALRQTGLPLADLSEASLLSAAIRKTGLSDWGDESFRIPLRILLESLEKEADLNFIGRYLLRDRCIRLLVNRLRIQADLKRYPEILQVPVQRPLFILGLPRTGTTLLHNLLAQDSSSRWLRCWELFNPSPPPERETSENDPRVEDVKKLIRSYNYLAPKLASAHYLNAIGPEECNQLFEHEFTGLIFELSADVPSYVKWLIAHDMVGPYRSFREQLQLLAWRYSGEYWLLKAPAHLLNLDALLSVFPDACIIQTHRDPLKVIPSLCSLSAIAREIYSDRVDLKVIGEHWLNRLAIGLEREMQVRESANFAQFYDVNYNDLVRDPIHTIHQIYEYFGYEFKPQFEKNMKSWLSQNPQHKHGIHRYSLEQFGLQPVEVSQRFAKYCERFNIIRNS